MPKPTPTPKPTPECQRQCQSQRQCQCKRQRQHQCQCQCQCHTYAAKNSQPCKRSHIRTYQMYKSSGCAGLVGVPKTSPASVYLNPTVDRQKRHQVMTIRAHRTYIVSITTKGQASKSECHWHTLHKCLYLLNSPWSRCEWCLSRGIFVGHRNAHVVFLGQQVRSILHGLLNRVQGGVTMDIAGWRSGCKAAARCNH